MGESILKIIIVLLVAANAGYMAYDGYHALTLGDYIRPAQGDYAGQLGPWTMFASMAGIDPMSTMMKSISLGLAYSVCCLFSFLSSAHASAPPC